MTDYIARSGGLNRRRAIQWMLVAAAAAPATLYAVGNSAGPSGVGYGTDPNLLQPPAESLAVTYHRNPPQGAEAAGGPDPAARGESPAASELGLVDFFEEWLSAPYPSQRDDRELILPLLEKVAAGGCDDPEEEDAWERLRLLTAAAYYTTPAGMADMGYVGNYPQREFKGPPADALALLDKRYEALGST